MKRRTTTAVGIACGALCAICVFAYMQSVRGEAEAARAEALSRYGGEQIEVCVARRDIAPGEKIDTSALETKLWVADLLPEQAVRAQSDISGQVASSPIFAGEVVSHKRFGETSSSIEVPVGYVALSVPAKTVQAVGGALVPGTQVDMYASGDTTTQAIAQNILVLATSSSGSEGKEHADMTWVTVAIEPDRVQEIIAASHKTELYFSLPSRDANDPSASNEGQGGEK